MATLYSLALSHPAHAARLMLERKGIEHQVVDLPPGLHAARVRLAGFRGATVPALELDGRRIQGSLEISRALERIQPDPPLFPTDATERAAVEEAERWGEAQLQPVPRRLIRWGAVHSYDVRAFLARSGGMPLPRVLAVVNAPITRPFARAAGANERTVRADLAELPGKLDHVDGLIAEGTIGGPEPNAADFQIGTSLRAIGAFPDIAGELVGRPADELSRRILPDFPHTMPAFLPAGWLDAAQA